MAGIFGGAIKGARGEIVGQIRIAVRGAGQSAGWAYILKGGRLWWVGLKGTRTGVGRLQLVGAGPGVSSAALDGTLDTASDVALFALTLNGAPLAGRYTAELALIRSLRDESEIDPSTTTVQRTAEEADRALVWIARSQWVPSSIAQRASSWAALFGASAPQEPSTPGGVEIPDPEIPPSTGEVDPGIVQGTAEGLAGGGVSEEGMEKLRAYIEQVKPYLKTAAQYFKWFMLAAGVLILARLTRRVFY